MQPLRVVEFEVTFQAEECIFPCPVILDVDLFIFHAPPQSLDVNVIDAAPLSVHADCNISRLKNGHEFFACELGTLVSVKDGGGPLPQGALQTTHAELSVQSVRQLPGQDVAAEPVHDGREVEKTPSQPYIGYVGAPNLIDAVHFDPS